jgi:transposase-like protein
VTVPAVRDRRAGLRRLSDPAGAALTDTSLEELFMAQGRPTKGSKIVTKFEASHEAEEKVRLVLETLAGKMSVKDAAAALDVSESRFHQVRDELLAGMLAAAEPKTVGRPKESREPEEVAALKQELADTKTELHVSRLRELLAAAFPELVRRESDRVKKKLHPRSRIVSSPGDTSPDPTANS